MAKIISCKELGEHETYDLELNHDDHQYYLSNGILTSNSHAVSYSILTFQCAWLLNYYPSEWMAAFLDKEPESRKEKAINIARSQGFQIASLDVNKSGRAWEISEDGKTLIQPLTTIKGLGDAAIDQLLNGRPFKDIEEFLYNENILYNKLNKRCRDVLVKSGALQKLMDKRFDHLLHFWTCVVDRPKDVKKFRESIETTRGCMDFTEEEKIEFLVSLTGVFPMHLVVNRHLHKQLEEQKILPLSKYNSNNEEVWFIPREVIKKKTKNGKKYYVVKVIDSTDTANQIRCWGIDEQRDVIHINRPYMAYLDYSEEWGFSCRNLKESFVLLA